MICTIISIVQCSTILQDPSQVRSSSIDKTNVALCGIVEYVVGWFNNRWPLTDFIMCCVSRNILSKMYFYVQWTLEQKQIKRWNILS